MQRVSAFSDSGADSDPTRRERAASIDANLRTQPQPKQQLPQFVWSKNIPVPKT